MISIIIPVLNEETQIETLLGYLEKYVNGDLIEEIIVVDGGSFDSTVETAKAYGIKVLEGAKGRAKQMNLGASFAKGSIFYFLHVDTLPPVDFDKSIVSSIERNSEAGCFRLKFDSDNKLLRLFSWFTRINHRLCRGGDQSLFITKSLFEKCNGFNEDYIIYEDNEFIGRLYNATKFKVLAHQVKTSARKYEKIGTLRLQYYFGMIHLQNSMGAGPAELYKYYQKKINTKI
ncbi:TIGR04283 family arsenosugar biosynthesis glycosyltransferase [Eudoraea chungangensis]|uniref:TIGR04283 family arsenosugar biosynthesis glycosyltransferase n=1 Tax=Eudoraea chungangensis TaxID=1481905 RepID=UPI0023EB5AA1|nr:TIGR04283 family arsenosugar biosynthesis glycosyltransferase [Eudoraea chungangensis]